MHGFSRCATICPSCKPVAEERPAAAGDHVVIDFEGFVDGKALEGGDATDHQLELGSNSFIPGFEEQVVGMNIGEQKRITLSFPEQYHSAELAGKASRVCCDAERDQG